MHKWTVFTLDIGYTHTVWSCRSTSCGGPFSL